MVTIAEIEQRQKELDTTKREAQKISKEPIPQRRFGSGVTREQQQRVLERRKSATETIGKVAIAKQQLKDVRTRVIQQQQAEARSAERARDFSIAKKALNNPALEAQLTRDQRTFFNDLQAGRTSQQQFIQEQAAAKDSGLTPVVRDGKVVGFEDTVTKQTIPIEEVPAIISEAPPESTPITGRERFEQAGVQFEEVKQPDRFGGEVVSAADTPEFVARTRTEKGAVGGTVAFVGRELTEVGLFLKGTAKFAAAGQITREGTLTPEAQAVSAGIATAGAGIISGETARAIGTKLRTITPQEAVGRGIVIAGTSVAAGKTIQFFRTPVRVAVQPVKQPTLRFISSDILNIQRGGQLKTISQFSILGTVEPRSAIELSRFRSLIQPITTLDKGAAAITMKELKTLQVLKGGRIVEISPAQAAITGIEPAVVKGGDIVGSVRGTRRVGSATLKGTPSRVEPIIISEFQGTLRKTIIDRKRVDLSTLGTRERTLLEELGPVIREGEKVQFGDVLTRDLLKIGTKEAKIIPRGRRLTRAELASAQREILEVQFESGEFGLRSFQKIQDKVAFIDVTKARVPRLKKGKAILELTDEGIILSQKVQPFDVKPRKIFTLEGQTNVFNVELPPRLGEVTKIKGVKPKRTPAQEQTLLQELMVNEAAINRLKAASASRVNKRLSQAKISKIKVPETKPVVSQSLFAGTGMFERTEGGLLPGEIVRTGISEPTTLREIIKPTVLSAPATITRDITRELARSSPREITREIPRTLPRVTPRTLPKLLPRQTPRQAPRQIPRVLPRVIPRQTPRFAPFPIIPGIRAPTNIPIVPGVPLGKRRDAERVLTTEGFRTFVIKEGEKVFLQGVRPRGKALKVGQERTLKTLRATFGVVGAGPIRRQKDIQFKVDPKVFRGFRVRKGERIDIPNTFIQKTTQEGGARGGRLASPTEVLNIQSARRRAGI